MKKLLGIVVLGLLLSGNTYAECKGNCVNGQGTMEWSNGDKYTGEWKNSETHGQGTIEWSNGDKYVGEWKNGKMHGEGTMSWAGGKSWSGMWKNNEKVDYVFRDNLYTDCDILTKKDPTTFKNLVFKKKKQLLIFDKRVSKSRIAEFFIFQATFENGQDVHIQVNSEFKTKKKAKKQALKYGKKYGQLPNFLRKNVNTITIHKGNYSWAASKASRDILIHNKGYSPDLIKCEEEVMLHESGHISLDPGYGGSIDWYSWEKAINADGKFISKYAKKNHGVHGEDVAETILWWVAARCKKGRISKSNYNKILEAIPNRIKYLDEKKYDSYPLACK